MESDSKKRETKTLFNELKLANQALLEDAEKHRLTEEILKESEEKFRTITTSAHDAIIMADNDGYVVFWNKAAEKIFGYSQELAIGKTVCELMVPEKYREAYSNGFNRFKETGLGRIIEKVVELTAITKDGIEFPISISISSVKIKDKWNAVGIIRDISEQKQAEDELKKNFQNQNILNNLLKISQGKESLSVQLEHALDTILSTPWLSILPKGGIFIVRDDTDLLVLSAARNLDEPLLETCARVQFGRCLCGKAALNRNVVFADSIGEEHENRYEGIKPHGHYVIPIMFMEEVLGVIVLYLEEGHIRDEQEVRFLEVIASTLADMIKRKRAEEQLNKLSHAIEQSPSTIVITDTEGNIEYVNSKFIRLTGYSFKEAIGKNPRILNSGIQSTQFYKEMWETITSGKEWRGDFCNRKKNGEFYWESASISGIKNNEGAITHFIANKEDITDRKRSEDRVNAQHTITQILSVSTTLKEAAQKILQTVCVVLNWDFGAIWMYDRHDNALHCSELWHDATIAISEFSDKTKESTFPPGIGLPGRVWASGKAAWIIDVVQDSNVPRAATARKVGLHGAFGFPIITGKTILGIIEFFSKEPKEPDNELLNMMSAIGSQIALFMRRIQASNELAESEDKFKKISSSANDAIIMLNNDEEVSYWNNAAEKIFGYSTEEVIGKKIHKLIIPERYREKHLEGYDRFKDAGVGSLLGKTIEVEAIKKNGTETSIELSLSAVKISDKWNAIGIIRDISERKRVEKELRIAHKMMSVGRLSSSVFHEILNPVNIISAHTQLLLMKAEKGSETEEDLISIKGEIDRIVDITENLQKFSKDEGGNVDRVEINGLLENVLSLLRAEFNLRKIKTVLKLENQLPEVMVHGSELRQAFLNIISNAIDAMPNGGSLTINTQCVQNKGMSFVNVRFVDTGCGIPKNDIDKVFEPFFSTKKEIKGVGLGLSSAYAIINGYGGELSIESEEEKGTTIIVYLPVIA